MSIFKDEKDLLKLIRYIAFLPIIIFSIIITSFLVQQKNTELNIELKTLEENYINEHKKIVKDEVLRVTNFLYFELESAKKSLKNKIKQRVYEAHSIANEIYENLIVADKSEDLDSKKFTFKVIKDALTGMSYGYGENKYIFISDIYGNLLLQPYNKQLEGKNFLHFEDKNGYRFVDKIIDTIKKKSEGFDTYYWYKPNDSETTYKKFSFYKYFEPFDLAIGSGEYLEDYENVLKKQFLQWIKTFRYNNKGYIFIFDSKGIYLSHSNEDLIGKNGFLQTDRNGRYIIKDIVKTAIDKKEAYIKYLFSKNPEKSGEVGEKISFVKYIKDLDWIIGSGFYLDNIDNIIDTRKENLIKEHEKIIKKIVLISIILTIVFAFISFYISKQFALRFTLYKERIDAEIDKKLKSEELLIQQSKMALMGEMIANIAHQWKQPLSTISMSQTLLMLERESKDLINEKEAKEALEHIDNSVKYLTNTIDDFKNFFNPNKKIKEFKVKELLERTTKLVSSQFRNNNIKIIEDVESFTIKSYENELLQVLINLLKNAKDELVKKDASEEKLICIKAYQLNSSCVIEIKDNAGGIPLNIIESIFEPYFTTKSEDKGTGIGLYMSKQIIENMNGTIEVFNCEFEYEGEKYKGANFKIVL